MSYTVLARKYRPQTFADVKGQEAVVSTLRRALETGRVSHSYLFTGSRGVGKTTIARLMAKALCCETGMTADVCGTCTACTEIAAGIAVDVIEIDGASHTKVDDIRELREAVRFQPQRLRFKVFIIDEVHMLSTSAFNALLKTLEEPPPHVKFIFATTEPHKIPVTILSRCQRYDFRRIPADTIVARLKEVLAAENMSIADDGLFVIARAAEGGMRDALSLTDQVLSFAGENADASDVAEALGLIDRRTLVRAVREILLRNTKDALLTLDKVFDQGHDLRSFIEAVAVEMRHLSIAKATGSIDGFVDLSDEDMRAIDALAHEHDARDLQRLFHIALEGTDVVSESDSPKLAAELILLRMTERPPVADVQQIGEAMTRLSALIHGRPVPPLSPSGGDGPGKAERLVRETLARSPSAPSSAPSSTTASANTNTERAQSVAAKPAPSNNASNTPVANNASLNESVSNGSVSNTPVANGSSNKPVANNASVNNASSDAFDDERADPPMVSTMNAAPLAGPMAAVAVNDDDDTDALDDDDADPALGLPLEGVDEQFKNFIDRVWRRHEQVGAHLAHARFYGVVKNSAGSMVRIGFDRSLHERAIKDAVNESSLKDALLEFYGDGAILDFCVVDDEKSRPPTLSEAQKKALDDVDRALQEHARAHPVVKKAIELFGGEVKSVRRASNT